MPLLIIAGVVLAVVAWLGWGKPVLTRGQWRVGTGLLSAVALGGAALVAARGGYEKAIVIAVVGILLAYATRSRRGPKLAAKPAPRAMSEGEARSLLGLDGAASVEDVRAAHTRLMKVAHPDRGGTTGLAAQLNAARDRLVKR
jgi:hypothetical protein